MFRLKNYRFWNFSSIFVGILQFFCCLFPFLTLTRNNVYLFPLEILLQKTFYLFAFSFLGNLFFSPYSLEAVLGMVYVGAGGNTAKQFRERIGFPSNIKQLEEGVTQSMSTIQKTQNITLNVANGMYVHQSFKTKPAFTKTITEVFNADVKNLNFGNSKVAAKEINGFVNTNTKGKIDRLFEDSECVSLLVLRASVFNTNIFFGNKI